MEIDISSLLENRAFDLSHSQAEGGPNAGRNTWQASLDLAEETDPPILDTEEKLQAMRDFARSSGGWDDEECAAWSPQEVNALFLQWVAGDTRQMPAVLPHEIIERNPGEWYRETEEFEWGPYESRAAAYEDYDGNRCHTAESLEEIDWEQAEVEMTLGRIPGNLFRADDNRIFFGLYE